LEEIDISLKCTHLKWNTKYLWRPGLGHPWNELCVVFLGCICKDGVGTITDVEGNINSAKYIDILLLVVLKLENYQWISQDDSAPGTPVSTDKILET
jgi:hypothetical protein